MTEADFDEFTGLLSDLASLYPHAGSMTPNKLAMMFRGLRAFTLAEVRAGLDAHTAHPTDCKFFPLPGQIIGRIQAGRDDDGRPGPEEAWSIAVAGQDESRTIVWTDEIAQAFGVANPLLSSGDSVGARMAFKEAYIGIIAKARASRQPLKWVASIGHDHAQRSKAIREAESLGRMVAGMEDLMLEHNPRGPVLMLETSASRAAGPGRQSFLALMAALKAPAVEPLSEAEQEARRVSLVAAERRRIEGADLAAKIIKGLDGKREGKQA